MNNGDIQQRLELLIDRKLKGEIQKAAKTIIGFGPHFLGKAAKESLVKSESFQKAVDELTAAGWTEGGEYDQIEDKYWLEMTDPKVLAGGQSFDTGQSEQPEIEDTDDIILI